MVWGLRRCPRFEFDLGEADDLALYADALPKLAQGGALIPVSWVHEKLRIPEAADGEAVFGAAAPAPDPKTPGHPASTATAGSAAQVALKAQIAADPAAPDAIDILVDADMADWQPLLDPLLAPLQEALIASAEAGETAAQLIERLPALLAAMDAGPLAERLAKTAFAARLAGNAGIAPDA